MRIPFTLHVNDYSQKRNIAFANIVALKILNKKKSGFLSLGTLPTKKKNPIDLLFGHDYCIRIRFYTQEINNLSDLFDSNAEDEG